MTENGAQELRDASGNLVGYFVPTRQFAEMQHENQTLRKHVKFLLPAATKEQEEEFRHQLETAKWIDGEPAIAALICELRNENGRP